MLREHRSYSKSEDRAARERISWMEFGWVEFRERRRTYTLIGARFFHAPRATIARIVSGSRIIVLVSIEGYCARYTYTYIGIEKPNT